MPEGDTVLRTAQALDRGLSGQVLTRSDFRVPQHATLDLAGGRVVQTLARGKHLLTRIEHDADLLTLHTHLKMEGAWRVQAIGTRWPRSAHQARVVLTTDTTEAIGFSLGIVEVIATAAEDSVVGHLGPDLLGPDWDPDLAVARLLREGNRPIHGALLDQTNLAGIGNMYAAELCFLAGVHPEAPVSSVPDLPRLVRRAHQVLVLNAQRAVQSTTGSLRERERMWVFRRDRSPCRRCGTPIAVAMTGDPGRERATYWCPSCQPAR